MIYGKTKEEANKKRNTKYEKLRRWHNWFAWYPVTIENGQRAWMETVERKIEGVYYCAGYFEEKKYRTVGVTKQ